MRQSSLNNLSTLIKLIIKFNFVEQFDILVNRRIYSMNLIVLKLEI